MNFKQLVRMMVDADMALVNRQLHGTKGKNRHEKRDGVASGFDWRQKVVVTGGAGFLGQAVVKEVSPGVVRRSLSPQQGL